MADQILTGIVIGLLIILTLQIIGAISNHFAWEAARKRFEQELRDHPPSTAMAGLHTLSGTHTDEP